MKSSARNVHRWKNVSQSRGLRQGVVALSAALAMASPWVLAQQPDANATLADIVRQALSSNPEVSARMNALLGAVDAVDAARGGLRPRVDVDAALGRTQDRISVRTPESQGLTQRGLAISASQLLWDGGAIRSDVARLGHERVVRWFEFVDASEQTALEAVRAFHDVLRFRRLVSLAEDNYVTHRFVTQQMGQRVQAGVGRGVDLEQANARLALAEANLTTETANLHDVTARYVRIVGSPPDAMLSTPSGFDTAMPPSAMDAMTAAVRDNAAVSASIESMRAARESVSNRRAGFQPKVEARVRHGVGRNFDGVPDQQRDTSAQLALTWNLYNGGSDQARVRQATRLLDQSADLRDKACRDVRQTASIAYNDTRKLVESLVSLEKNTASIIRARDAYRQQFDIGQRNLLDLLNAESEVYTARRAVVNARVDLAIAQARTLAAMQRLTQQLGVSRPDAQQNAPVSWAAGSDAPTRCPVEVGLVQGTTPRSELDARAEQLIKSTPPMVPPAVPPAASVTPAAPSPATSPSPAKR